MPQNTLEHNFIAFLIDQLNNKISQQFGIQSGTGFSETLEKLW